jgi:hypothetical protein
MARTASELMAVRIATRLQWEVAWIFGASALGVALVGGVLWVYAYLCPEILACPSDPRDDGSICLFIARSPPWTMLTGLASAPALVVLWMLRTKHKREEISNANQQQISNRFAEAVKLLANRRQLEATCTGPICTGPICTGPICAGPT